MYLKLPRLTLFSTLILLMSFAIIPIQALEVQEASNCNFFKDARADIGGSVGQFIGVDKNYGEFGLFIPTSFSDEWTVFADGKAFAFENSKWGSSVGLGMRGIVCGDRIWGTNLYYDYRNGRRESFSRIGIGFEWLGSCLDFRINGYCPFSRRGFDCSYSKGFDTELGAPVHYWRDFEVYVAAGSYFYGCTRAKDFWGGYGRLELNWRDYISFQVRTSYDRHYHSNTQFQASLNIPFEVLCSWQSFEDYCSNLVTQSVERNSIIFIRHHCHDCRVPIQLHR